jgi:hypothetical protein
MSWMNRIRSPLGNSLVLATRKRSSLDDLRANLPRFDEPLLAEVARRAVAQARAAEPPAASPIFTDDHAPVEHVVHRLVLRHMFGDH